MNRAPVLFISHGSPDLAVSDNAITESWRSLQQHFNQVNAVVVLSAHWLTDAIHIGANPDPDLVYDFSGFPEALYKLKYPAKMDKAVSLKVQAAVQQHFKHNVNLDSRFVNSVILRVPILLCRNSSLVPATQYNKHYRRSTMSQ